MRQQALSMTGDFDKGKKMRRAALLAEMDQVVPWQRLCAMIEPWEPKKSAAGGHDGCWQYDETCNISFF
jgi:hypothetical protein